MWHDSLGEVRWKNPGPQIVSLGLHVGHAREGQVASVAPDTLSHPKGQPSLLGANEDEPPQAREDLPDVLQFECFSSRALHGWLSARPQLKRHVLEWPFLMPPPPWVKSPSLLDSSFRHVSI